MRGSLVIPTLNEAASIGHVLETFRSGSEEANERLFVSDPIDWEVLVVDGDSADGTGRIAEANGARVIVERRKGYGRAYRTGFEVATGDVIATLDGDATYPTDEVPKLVRHLLDQDLDFVTTDRLKFLSVGAMTREHRIGNWVLNRLMRLAYHRYFRSARGATINDSQSGMWVFRRSILPQLSLTQDGMPFSEELKLEVLVHGLRFDEVPIHYAERWGAPKLSSYRDGRQNLMFLVEKRIAIHRETKMAARPPSKAREAATR